MARIVAAAAALLAVLVATPAMAVITSAYTSLDLDRCQAEPMAEDNGIDGGVWWCAGYAGIPVRVAEGDLRFLVSYGPDAANELAAGQTLPQFNTIHTTLEWRLDDGRPFATILRYFTDTGDGRRGQVLVVTRLGETGTVCHVGYVDALANPEANALAREIADGWAPGFVCGIDEPAWAGVGAGGLEE
jgi:hypothetical protein